VMRLSKSVLEELNRTNLVILSEAKDLGRNETSEILRFAQDDRQFNSLHS